MENIRQAIQKAMGYRRAAEDEDEAIGELEVSEYIIFLLALDTFMRYIEETTGEDPRDEVTANGLRLLRLSDAMLAESLTNFLDENLPSKSLKKLLARAMQIRVSTPEGAARRAFQLRTLLSLGGASTQRAVFKTNKSLRQVREAISAAMMADADAALDQLEALQMRNSRLRGWIRLAAKTAVQREIPKNIVEAGSKEAVDQANELLTQQVQSAGASGAEEQEEAKTKQSDVLTQVEQEATQAAKKALASSGEADIPPTRSEVVGLAVAAATAAISDPSKPQNVPDPLRKLDDEQRAAALTDGRVLVAAGAGAGKSTTVVSRVEYLVKERRVLPSRVLVTSFNTKAANELKQKIGSAVGGDALDQMSVGTMHSLFRKFIGEYGTPQERSAMGLGKDRGGFIQNGGAVARTVQRLWAECFPEGTDKEKEVPKLKNVLQFKSKWSGNNISPADARAQAKTQKEEDAALWYEYYEGLKGSIPGWQPPCRGKAYESFMARWRPNDQRLGDFDDMLTIFRDILKREPIVRKSLQKMFDHLLVDEAQDLSGVQYDIISMMSEHVTDGKDGKSLWICGDDKQCVAADTPILIPGASASHDEHYHYLPADRLSEGSSVISYRNGNLVPQKLRYVKPSSWTWGYKVTTVGGRTLTMSPNHKIWATPPETQEGQVAVYLMYRHDIGFRVGITNKWYSEDYYNSFGGRAFMEKAERMWFLDICQDREEALLKEVSYSLKYGVPTAVFEGENRGINQERIDAVFTEFGKNGGRILEDKRLSFDLPHWMSHSYSKHDRLRRTIQMIAHSSHNTQVAMEWQGDDLDNSLSAASISFGSTSKGTKRIRKWFSSYREGLTFAERLQGVTGANLHRRLSMDEGPLLLLTASALFPGMSVAVVGPDETLIHEEIASVEKVEGVTFLDLDVDDASNFIGGGILSHNSIYSFRGARPDLFTRLATTEGWVVRMIRTNYRCQPEIVEAANKLIAYNEDQIPMEAIPSPAKSRHIASIVVETPSDEAGAALTVVEQIKSNIGVGEDVAGHAVLCRTNKELHSYETACIIRGIPYARKGASSFLGSPETKTVLGYAQLVTGDDYSKMQAALADVINRPNRFFVSPDAATKAVEEVLGVYARRTRQDVKSVNPLVALGDVSFQSTLAEKLTRQRSGFKFNKTVEKIEEMADALSEMQALSQQEGFSTKDLFDNILNLSGTVAVTDPRTGRSQFVEQSLRDSLRADLRDSTSDDDDDDDEEDDETKGLGNVAFLYKLAEPDPTDPDDLATPPTSPFGFKAKMERYAARARELRIDITAYEKKQQALPPAERKPPPGVYLGTVHSVKGAQWKNCFVQMPAGKFPFKPPVKPGEPPPPPEEVQEQLEGERRLAYVALTRAAMNLTVVCPDVVGGKPAGVSEFVSEAGLRVGENVPKPGAAEPPIETSPEVEGTKTATLHDGYEGELPEGWE